MKSEYGLALPGGMIRAAKELNRKQKEKRGMLASKENIELVDYTLVDEKGKPVALSSKDISE